MKKYLVSFPSYLRIPVYSILRLNILVVPFLSCLNSWILKPWRLTYIEFLPIQITPHAKVNLSIKFIDLCFIVSKKKVFE